MVGASKVKKSSDVPTRVPKVIAKRVLSVYPVAAEHWTVVPLDQLVVPHDSRWPPEFVKDIIVGVNELDPKFRPLMVTNVAPDVAEFERSADVTAGPSYVNAYALVPTSVATVTRLKRDGIMGEVDDTSGIGNEHLTWESEVQ
jgi:hypothetical protein